MKIQPVVIAIIKKDNKFLLTKRVKFDPEDKDFYPFVWQFPGGGFEYGETPERALIREIKEELGVEIKIIFLLSKVFVDARRNWQGVFISFVCQLKNPQAKIVLNDEASEYGWFTPNEVFHLKLLPKTIEMIKKTNKITI
ncbi:MAG: NUDIX hydrolase [Ignavibacteriaceae bacterium]